MKQARLTDDAWDEIVPDRQSAPAQSGEADRSGEDHPQTKQALRERAAAHAADVATEHFPEVPVTAITWEISTRMQRSAGKAIYRSKTEEITIRLSWDVYKAYGWEQFARVVRHELIHAWQYFEYEKAGHGPTFRQWIEPLDTDRHCERYADPKYWVVCRACERRDPRYRRSKVVKQPDRYSCGQCDGDLVIETL